MSNIVETDYTVENVENTEQELAMLKIMADRILSIERNVLSFAVSGAIEVGKILTEAKKIVGYGQWGDWCKDNLNYSQKKAQRLMKIAEEYGDENNPYSKATNLSNLSVSKALALLQVPEEEVEEFTNEHNVDDMSFKELEKEIRQMKREKEAAEDALKDARGETDRLLDEKEDMASQLQTMEARMASLEQQLAVAKSEPQVDTAEVDDLKNKLDAAKKKLKEAKDELKKEQAGRQAAIDQAIGNQQQAMKQEAKEEAREELEEAKKSIGELLEKVDQLEKRAANAGDEKKVQFKIHMDQLQADFGKALNCIFEQPDPEMQVKMMTAMNTVLDKMSREAKI